jgi:hypothetical protein
MRLLVIIALIGASAGSALADDAHTEMAAALSAHANLHPAPASLPVANAAGKVAQTPAAKHIPPQAAVVAGHAAAGQAQQGQGSSAALAHQAQSAAMSAAGQAQAEAGRQRAATHPHPGH